MNIPVQVRLLAALAGQHSRDFAVGWANGLVRWKTRPDAWIVAPPNPLPGNPFADGSVKAAASEAAVAFMRNVNPEIAR